MAQKKSLKLISSAEAKQWLRGYFSRRRQSLTILERRQKSIEISRYLFRSSEFKKANTVALFLGFGTEVKTERILHRAWREGKTVVIPVSAHGFHKAYLGVINKRERLVATQFGPLEPAGKKKPFPYSRIDLVLVPGLGFDRKGHRLGYGGGVYDRLLMKVRAARHIGLFFENQGVHRLPFEDHDHPLDAIITEKGRISVLAKSAF